MDKKQVEELRIHCGRILGVVERFTVNRTEANAFRIVVGGGIRFGPRSEVRRPIHPFHLLTLFSALAGRIGQDHGLSMASDESFMTLNYGFEDVSFGRPVYPEEWMRATMTLKSIEEKDNGCFLIRRPTIIEVEGEKDPILNVVGCSYWMIK